MTNPTQDNELDVPEMVDGFSWPCRLCGYDPDKLASLIERKKLEAERNGLNNVRQAKTPEFYVLDRIKELEALLGEGGGHE